MADTHGFEVVLEASPAVIRKALRGAWKSAECPVDPGDTGRIPEFIDIPVPLLVGGYEIEDGQVQIPEAELDAALAPDVNGAELKFGLHVQLHVKNPPVPSAQLLDFPVDVRARVPIGTLPNSQDVGLLLDGLPRSHVSTDLTAGHPLTPKLDTLLDEFIHLVYENGGTTPPTPPFIPHVVSDEDVSFAIGGFPIAQLDIHAELFDDESDPAYRINVTRPDPATIRISIPIYLRMFDITSEINLRDPMGIETRLNISAPFESAAGVYRANLSTPDATVDAIKPASAVVAGDPNEGARYTLNKATIATLPLSPNLDQLIADELTSRGKALAMEIGDVSIPVPSEAEIEAGIGDFFHAELKSRGFLALWTPSATDEEFEVDNVAVEVIAEALIIALNGGAGADVTAITGFIPNGREFAIALSGTTVQRQINQAIDENGFDDLPKRFTEDGKKVDLNSLNVFLTSGAIRMEGEVTVIDAVLGSIDVDADFRVNIGLHWEPDGALNADGFQELKHHIIGEPEVDPQESVLFWVIAVILAIISFGAGSVLIAIIIIVVALIVQSIASNIGSSMMVNSVTGAIEGLQAWPPDLSRIGRVAARFHNNTTSDPDGILIDATGLVLEGTMEVISSCESTQVLGAYSGSTYSVNAASPVLLKAGHTSSAASYRWLAGDASPEVSLRDKTHTYLASGLYVAKHGLTINQPGGASSRHFALVEVRNVPPVVDVGPDLTVDEGEVVTLIGRFSDVEPGDTHESMWLFGDDQSPQPGVLVETNTGSRAEGTSTVTHAWCDNGEYVVLLRVRDQNGGIGTDTLRVTVRNVDPIVEAGPDLYAYPCSAITLTGHFQDPGWCDTHTGSWSFGDCSPAHPATISEVNQAPAATGVVIASHVYHRCGTYHALCAVVDDDGGVGSDYVVIRVVDVANPGFESGFRPFAVGDVANAWYPYGCSAGMTLSARPEAGQSGCGIAAFSCEQCGVHAGQRSQGIALKTSAPAGVRQSIGANPGWTYQVSAWCHVEPGRTARLGIDPSGGTDPQGSGLVWSDIGTSADWLQLVQRVVANGQAITIFLEATSASSAESAGRNDAKVRFDDVELVAIQPYCPEAPAPEVPTERCVDFTEFEPGTTLPPVYERAGFKFTAMDHQALRLVGLGAPAGKTKLALGRIGILVALPFSASRVRVEVSVNSRTPVYVLALSSSQQPETQASTSVPTGLETLNLSGSDILLLQIGSKGSENTLFRICATPAPFDPSAPKPPTQKQLSSTSILTHVPGPAAGAGREAPMMSDPRDLEAVRAILGRRRIELMERYQAEGVGIGRHDDGYAIVVYLKSAKHRPAESQDIEGVPLRFEVTGTFKTQTN